MNDDELAAKEELELALAQDEPVEPADRDVPAEMIALERIPRRLWEQTLAPFHRSQRGFIVRQVSDPELQEIAWEVAYQLDRAESTQGLRRQEARAAALRGGAPLPAPGADHGAAQPTVQVNLRLRPDDHGALSRAAAAVGLRPTTLARALVLNGAAMILREHPQPGSEP